MILRRFVVLVLALLCYSRLPAQDIKPAPTDCPISDGYSWTRFRDRPSGKVLWVQVRHQDDFEKLCGGYAACAWRFEEVTLIVAQSPSWVYGEAFRKHEECHDGWYHEDGRWRVPFFLTIR